MLHAPRGIAIFKMASDYPNGAVNQSRMMTAVDTIRQVSHFPFTLSFYGTFFPKYFLNIHPQMSELWHCLALVVVSDDQSFLAAFANLSLKRHALRWSTRILVLTHLPLRKLSGLHGLLSNRNAMLLLLRESETFMR